jgi:chemotaxis protein MotB
MAGRNSSRSRHEVDAWPGWVDALSSLLMVVIFVLLVFMIAQFYLTTALSGRDEQLSRLNVQLEELSQLLSLEKQDNEALRVNLATLSTELQNAVSSRDGLRASLAELQAERDGLRSQLATANSKLAGVQTQTEQLDARLADAVTVIDADRDKIELQLREIASLQADLKALREAREKLELELAALAAVARNQQEAAKASDADLNSMRTELGLSEDQRQTLEDENAARQQRIEALVAEGAQQLARIDALEAQTSTQRARIGELEAERTQQQNRIGNLEADLAGEREATRIELRLNEEQRKALLAELTQMRDRSKGLESELASAQERTTLAQKDIEDKKLRIEELLAAAADSADALDEQKKLTSLEQAQVALLNQQLAELRRQMAALNQTLEVIEAENKAKNVQILDLGKRLNAALATRLQDLARYRSDFFGKLREVLGDREDVRIVGDRFVFQSEVLFESASADLDPNGARQMASFARELVALALRIPPEIDWVLRVDGHTDSLPINTPQFPSNWELSAARAIAVVKYLVAQGVPPERLVAAGYGEYRPLDSSANSPEVLRRNRRIEMKLDQR